MSLIDDACDGCGRRYDPMGDPILTRHPEVGEWIVFCDGCERAARPKPTLPPERVEELAEALRVQLRLYTLPANVATYYGPVNTHDTVAERCGRLNAEALAPLIAGWLAEAYSRGVNDTFDTDGALMRAREQGAAEVRARVEAWLATQVDSLGGGHNLVRVVDLRAALATEREEDE